MDKIKKKHVGLIVLVSVIVIGLGMFGFISANEESDTAVKSLPVVKGTVSISTSADGRAVVDLVTELNFTGAGTIAEIYVAEGQAVKKDQKLARLDSRKLSYQLSQAKAGYTASKAKLSALKDGPSDAEIASKRVAVENAKIALADAQASYDYALSEYNAGRIPKDQLITKEAQLNSAKSQLKTAESQLAVVLEPANQNDISSARASVNQAYASVQVSEMALDEAAIKAPMNGMVMAINRKVGENAGGQSSGAVSEPFMVIGDADRMMIEAEVEEIDIAKVSIGQRIRATFDALEGEEFYGAVQGIEGRAKIDQNGVVTYLVRVSVDNKKSIIKDGMTAHVDFILKEAKDVLIVPVKAVARINGKPTVIVQTNTGTMVRKQVELGITDGSSVEVKKGLSLGEKVVIKEEAKKE